MNDVRQSMCEGCGAPVPDNKRICESCLDESTKKILSDVTASAEAAVDHIRKALAGLALLGDNPSGIKAFPAFDSVRPGQSAGGKTWTFRDLAEGLRERGAAR